MGLYNGLENRNILVVEDVELNQHLARHIMESWGCVVEIAENGALAIEKINAKDYDLVLMDIQMPVMDGIEATRNIRALSDTNKASTPVVALTANALKGECEPFLKAGMNDCLPKPFEEKDLFRIVYRHIRNTGAQATVISSCTAEADKQQLESDVVPMYNLAMVEAISGGDAGFITKMLQLFLDTVPATLNDIKVTAGNAEWLPLSKHAHKLKSTIDSMGIVSLKQDIRFIESNGKAGTHLDQLPQLADKVIGVMQQVMAQVKKDHSL